MGLILDDHGKGIHAEARSKSFSIYDDFGDGFSVELEWEKLPELAYLAEFYVDSPVTFSEGSEIGCAMCDVTMTLNQLDDAVARVIYRDDELAKAGSDS